jgi:hypothetical protein
MRESYFDSGVDAGLDSDLDSVVDSDFAAGLASALVSVEAVLGWSAFRFSVSDGEFFLA